MGTSNAFYTFISQKPRGSRFLAFYAGWQFLQFLTMILLIGIILPDEWLSKIWLGQDRSLVFLSFIAVFMQQHGWITITQIGESSRLTHKVQIMNLLINLVYFLVICGFWVSDLLSLRNIFILIIFEYIAGILIGIRIFKVYALPKISFNGKKIFREYVAYCSPLLIYSIMGFAHHFLDRWFLQNFGGSEEQGIYEVSYRFVMIGLLAATSLVNIFWKELAEAQQNKNLEQMQHLYVKVSRFLFTCGAVISGLLIPWSQEITGVLLSSSYGSVPPVLIIMLVFSIYAATAQINQTFLYATNKTRELLIFGTGFAILSIPFSYVMLAPQGAIIPSLELGAIGMALKRSILLIIQVNVITWWICHRYGWSFDWKIQIISLICPLFLGLVARKISIALVFPFSKGLIFSAGISLLLYISMVAIMIWTFPWIAGLQRKEILQHLKNTFKVLNLN